MDPSPEHPSPPTPDAAADGSARDAETSNIVLPRAYEHAPTDHLVVLIADMLSRLCAHNDRIPLSPASLTRFHSRAPPQISVLDYLRRIVRYANLERTPLLIALHYIDQLSARLPHFAFSSLTAHRFLIASSVVASKALCDAFCTNAHYARVGGIRVQELNLLERELLAAIDWRLTSTREVLDAYYINLVRTHSTGAYVLEADPNASAPASPTFPSPTFPSPTLDTPTSSTATLDAGAALALPTGPAALVTPSGFGAETTSPAHSDDSMDMDADSARSSSPSSGPGVGPASPASTLAPLQPPHTLRAKDPTAHQRNTVLPSTATLSPRAPSGPTLEQNMAFAALQGERPSDPSNSSSSNATVAAYSEYDFDYASYVRDADFGETGNDPTKGKEAGFEHTNGRIIPRRRSAAEADSGEDEGGGGEEIGNGDSGRPRTRPRLKHDPITEFEEGDTGAAAR